MQPSRLNLLYPGCLCHSEAWLADAGCGTEKPWKEKPGKELLLSLYCMYLIHLIFLYSLLLPTCTTWQENGIG